MLLARFLVIALLGLDWWADPQLGRSAFSQPLSSQLSVTAASGAQLTLHGLVKGDISSFRNLPSGEAVPAGAARAIQTYEDLFSIIPTRSLVYCHMTLRR